MNATETQTRINALLTGIRIGHAIARDEIARARVDGDQPFTWTGLEAQDADQIPDDQLQHSEAVELMAGAVYDVLTGRPNSTDAYHALAAMIIDS